MRGKALARNQFAKAARAPVKAPEGLADHVADLLVQRCLDRIGLARRAGELVVGFDQVADWLRGGRCGLVLCARDGAAEGRRRIETLALMAGVGLPHAAVRDQVAVAIDVVVHQARRPNGSRVVESVSEVTRVAGGAGTRELWSRGGRLRRPAHR